MTYKIINSTWYTNLNGDQIGIVKIHCEDSNEVKYYIGCAYGYDQQYDEQRIAEYGTPFYPGIFKE